MMVKFTLSWLPKRYLIVIMVFIGYVIFFGLHTNIGMAVVAMTSPRNISTANGTVVIGPEFNWTSIEKATVISSLAYGRFFGPIGGVLAGRIGGSTMYTLGLACTALVSFCLPFCLRISFYLFVFGNALTGLFESFAYASVSQLWSRWAPPNERAKIISFSVIGIYGGPVVSFVASGWILQEWGWVTLFYATGTVVLLWTFVWFLLVKNDPADDKWMSEEEKAYIKKELSNEMHDDDARLEYPWKDLLTCVPFWIGCLGKFVIGVGFTFTMMYLPQYIRDINNIDIKQIGYISVVPQMCSIIAMPVTGYLFDYIRSNQILSLNSVHKWYACIGLLVSAITYTTAGLWPNFIVCMVCVSLFSFFITFSVLEVQVLMLDLAPRYAGFMNAVAISAYALSSILTPIIVGFIVTSESQLQWSGCFVIFGLQYITVALLFWKFGSGKLQHWANYSPSNIKSVSTS